jgi:hypothetical protein
MHAQQLYLNVCKTAILGYHGDKIISHKSANNIKYVKKSQVFQVSHLARRISRILVFMFSSFLSHLLPCDYIGGSPNTKPFMVIGINKSLRNNYLDDGALAIKS